MSNAKTAMQVKETMSEAPALDTKPVKVGTFAVFDTQQVKGLRINLEKIRNYAMNGDDSVQISYDNSGSTILKFKNEAEALQALERLDSFCL